MLDRQRGPAKSVKRVSVSFKGAEGELFKKHYGTTARGEKQFRLQPGMLCFTEGLRSVVSIAMCQGQHKVEFRCFLFLSKNLP